jgi:hypothetical protein
LYSIEAVSADQKEPQVSCLARSLTSGKSIPKILDYRERPDDIRGNLNLTFREAIEGM